MQLQLLAFTDCSSCSLSSTNHKHKAAFVERDPERALNMCEYVYMHTCESNIQPSPPPDDLKSVGVHRTVLELHSKTELQRSAEQLKQLRLDLKQRNNQKIKAELAVSTSCLQCVHSCTDVHHWVTVMLQTTLKQDFSKASSAHVRSIIF